MDNWKPYLHLAFRDELVLISPIRLSSFGGFLAASFLAVVICLAERLITFSLEKHWTPGFARGSRWKRAAWRTYGYWVATVLRLCYMLITMTFHLGLLLVVATALASAQFFIELDKSNYSNHPDSSDMLTEPLLHGQPHPLTSVSITRPRSRSKPQDLSIRAEESNVARAQAALQRGVFGGKASRTDHTLLGSDSSDGEAEDSDPLRA